TERISPVFHTSHQITADLFGADMLRFRRTDNFEIAAEAAGVSRIRWPGEGIVDPTPTGPANLADDRWINAYGPDGTPSVYAYDLSHDNIISTVGFPRDGLREAMSFAISADVGFTMLVPEERYIIVDPSAVMPETVFQVDFAGIVHDLSTFLNRLLSGHFGVVPENFVLQIGQEYYTGPISDAVASCKLNHLARMGGTGAFYNFVASFIKQYVEERTDAGLNPHGIEVGVSIQMGRFLREPAGDPAFGSSDDVAILAKQFDEVGLSSIDEMIFQRYVPRFQGVSDGLSAGFVSQSLRSAQAEWFDRFEELGVSTRPEVTVGWAKSSYTRSEARVDFADQVTDTDF
ncbi:MAG: hypothetical protein AAFY91_14220, partial [Bacteroidota bacterium]